MKGDSRGNSASLGASRPAEGPQRREGGGVEEIGVGLTPDRTTDCQDVETRKIVEAAPKGVRRPTFTTPFSETFATGASRSPSTFMRSSYFSSGTGTGSASRKNEKSRRRSPRSLTRKRIPSSITWTRVCPGWTGSLTSSFGRSRGREGRRGRAKEGISDWRASSG